MVAKKAPAVGKDVSFPFQTAITCWIDLLGYGRMMSDAGFNPLAPEADVVRLGSPLPSGEAVTGNILLRMT